MDLGGLNPQDMQQYLQGLSWSADKEQVAQTAESNGAPQSMLDQMETSAAASSPGPRT